MRFTVYALLGCYFAPASCLRKRSNSAVNTSSSVSLTGAEANRMTEARRLTVMPEESSLIILEKSLDMYKEVLTSTDPVSVGDMVGFATNVGLALVTASNPALGLVVGFFNGLIFGEPERNRNDYDKIVQAVLSEAKDMVVNHLYMEKKAEVDGLMNGIFEILDGIVPTDEKIMLIDVSNDMSLHSSKIYGDCPQSPSCKGWRTKSDGFDNLLFELAFADLDVMIRLQLLAHYTGDEQISKKESLKEVIQKHSDLLTAHYNAFKNYITSDSTYTSPTRAPLEVCNGPGGIQNYKCGTYKQGLSNYTNRTFEGSQDGICKLEGQEAICLRKCQGGKCEAEEIAILCSNLQKEWQAEVKECLRTEKMKAAEELDASVGPAVRKFQEAAKLSL